MRDEPTVIIEEDDGWFISRCPEIPGANGQGRTREESLDSLAAAITLLREDAQASNSGEPSLKEFLAGLAAAPRQVRSQEEIDRYLEEERASWD